MRESHREDNTVPGNYGNTETSGEDSSDSDSEASDDKSEEVNARNNKTSCCI